MAIGVNNDGCREIIGAAEGMKEGRENWRSFFVGLKERGLTSVRLIIGDKNLRDTGNYTRSVPRCPLPALHSPLLLEHLLCHPTQEDESAAMMLKALHAQESKEAALEKACHVAEKLSEMKLSAAAKKLQDGNRRNAYLYGFSHPTLEPDSDKQHDRTAEPRDQAPD